MICRHRGRRRDEVAARSRIAWDLLPQIRADRLTCRCPLVLGRDPQLLTELAYLQVFHESPRGPYDEWQSGASTLHPDLSIQRIYFLYMLGTFLMRVRLVRRSALARKLAKPASSIAKARSWENAHSTGRQKMMLTAPCQERSSRSSTARRYAILKSPLSLLRMYSTVPT